MNGFGMIYQMTLLGQGKRFRQGWDIFVNMRTNGKVRIRLWHEVLLVSFLSVSILSLWGCGKKPQDNMDMTKNVPIVEDNQKVDGANDKEQKSEVSDTEPVEPTGGVIVPEEISEEMLVDEDTIVDIESQVDEFLAKMTTQEKVAQMFIVLPEAFIGVDTVTSAGEATKAAIDALPVGGLIYMEPNLQNTEQVRDMLSNLQTYSQERIGLPMFTAIDEEGGVVARISGRDGFNVPPLGNMSEIGRSLDASRAIEVGDMMGQYLSDMGFNVNFAPDADVLSNPDNSVVNKRSFGSNPKVVTDMTMSVAQGLQAHGVCATYKHFPGHGATTGDTHDGYAYTDKSLAELQTCELIPFERAITDEIPFIMVGHISAPNIIGDNTPSTLSYTMITEILRNNMGYEGIVITDAMNMGAIVQSYSSGEAAVKTIKAGTDIVLMPADFHSAYQGVLAAVADGTISIERIDESVRRILKVKLELMK